MERDSQKSIVIGTEGARLKDVGTRARAEIEQLLGRRVYLDLHVRVAKEWQRDPKQLAAAGFLIRVCGPYHQTPVSFALSVADLDSP